MRFSAKVNQLQVIPVFNYPDITAPSVFEEWVCRASRDSSKWFRSVLWGKGESISQKVEYVLSLQPLYITSLHWTTDCWPIAGAQLVKQIFCTECVAIKKWIKITLPNIKLTPNFKTKFKSTQARKHMYNLIILGAMLLRFRKILSAPIADIFSRSDSAYKIV